MRDVIFDETLFYDPSELDLGYILLDKIVQLLEVLELPNSTFKCFENTIKEAIDDSIFVLDIVNTISSVET
jgi:hypothetical protein